MRTLKISASSYSRFDIICLLVPRVALSIFLIKRKRKKRPKIYQYIYFKNVALRRVCLQTKRQAWNAELKIN